MRELIENAHHMFITITISNFVAVSWQIQRHSNFWKNIKNSNHVCSHQQDISTFTFGLNQTQYWLWLFTLSPCSTNQHLTMWNIDLHVHPYNHALALLSSSFRRNLLNGPLMPILPLKTQKDCREGGMVGAIKAGQTKTNTIKKDTKINSVQILIIRNHLWIQHSLMRVLYLGHKPAVIHVKGISCLAHQMRLYTVFPN